MGRQGKRKGRDEPAREILWPLAFLVGCAVHTICVAGILPACVEGVPPSEELEQTLASVQECMARSPAPWPQEWQSKYDEALPSRP
jgi:hypothetical protein